MKQLKGLRFILPVFLFSAALLPAAEVMPDLRGETMDSARIKLASIMDYEEPDSVQLTVLPDSTYTDSIAPGLIGWQEPLPDSAMTDTIKVRIAAPLTIPTPDILGVELEQAQKIIVGKGLEFFPVREEGNLEYPKGTICEMNPDPGEPIQRGQTVGVVTSIGIPERIPTRTESGVEVHLYEDVQFTITQGKVASFDSTGFVVEFTLRVRNPFEHEMSARKLRYELQVNRGRLLKGESDVSIPVGVGETNQGKVTVEIPYDKVIPAIAKAMLDEASYRLVGTYALVVETGFTRRNFDARGMLNLFAQESAVREKLDSIAFGEE